MSLSAIPVVVFSSTIFVYIQDHQEARVDGRKTSGGFVYNRHAAMTQYRCVRMCAVEWSKRENLFLHSWQQ